MQLIKGGFSFRAKRELGFTHNIWQPSYYDRRVRDAEEYFAFRECIDRMPWKVICRRTQKVTGSIPPSLGL